MTLQQASRIAIGAALWAAIGGAWYWWEFMREPATRRIKPSVSQDVGAYTVGSYATTGGTVQVINVVSPDPSFDGMLEHGPVSSGVIRQPAPAA
ncbi:MAG: hypothetical protein ACK4F7_04495 [Inhella sp.]